MRYTLLLHYPELQAAGELDDEAIQEGQAAFRDYAQALDGAGALISAEVLQPSSATSTLRLVDGALTVQDGPYADTKEQLGGTFVIEVDDLDAAIAWAEKAPSAFWGPIEIRPSATRFENGAWTA